MATGSTPSDLTKLWPHGDHLHIKGREPPDGRSTRRFAGRATCLGTSRALSRFGCNDTDLPTSQAQRSSISASSCSRSPSLTSTRSARASRSVAAGWAAMRARRVLLGHAPRDRSLDGYLLGGVDHHHDVKAVIPLAVAVEEG